MRVCERACMFVVVPRDTHGETFLVLVPMMGDFWVARRTQHTYVQGGGGVSWVAWEFPPSFSTEWEEAGGGGRCRRASSRRSSRSSSLTAFCSVL